MTEKFRALGKSKKCKTGLDYKLREWARRDTDAPIVNSTPVPERSQRQFSSVGLEL